jgi:hypothetical protein
VAEYTPLQLTAIGQNALAKAQTGIALQFTKVKFGDGTATDISSLTDLVRPVMTVPLTSTSIVNGIVKISCLLSNDSLANGFYVKEIGLFATQNGQEFLYAYTKATNADYIPPVSSGPITQQFNFQFAVQAGTNITFQVPNDAVVLQTEKGQANGVATLDTNAKVPATQLPLATPTTPGAMSAPDKAKLDGIAPGAEVNQNAWSNIKVGATTISADSETDTLELIAGSNIVLTPNDTNDSITIAANVPVTSVNGKTGAVSLTASDVGAETPSGAQAKANTAETNAKNYADSKAATAENNAKAYADSKAAQAETNAKVASVAKTGDTMTGTLKFNMPLPSGVNTSDTPDKWPNDGIAYYTVDGPGKLQGQPTQFGKIMHIAHSGAKFQYFFEWWHPQGAPSGSFYYRHAGEGDTVWGQWHKIWHAGNDGAGSGLDADLLDGLDSSAFVKKAGDTMTGTLAITGSGKTFTISPHGAGVDLHSTGNIAPHFQSSFSLFTGTPGSGTLKFQVNADGTVNLKGEADVNGNKVWHAGNDGAGSGLDADLLDGLDSSAFVKKAGDTMTGTLYVPLLILTNSDGINEGGELTLKPAGSWTNDSHIDRYQDQIRIWTDGGKLLTIPKTGDLTWGGQKIWTAENDGAGSGLDADTVDGKQASDFVLQTEKGAPNGVATLDASGKVPASQLNISMTGSAISISDSGGYYTSGNVEGALQEIGQVLNAMRGSLIDSVNNILNM